MCITSSSNIAVMYFKQLQTFLRESLGPGFPSVWVRGNKTYAVQKHRVALGREVAEHL